VGFVITRVAREHGRSVRATARESYALTLWTFLQSEEVQRFSSLIRERENLMLADMVRVGFHMPNKFRLFESDWRQRVIGTPATQETIEEMSRRADELWALHESIAMKKRPVS
jgi:hypothetical protein